MTTLASVISKGLYSAIPPAGMAGRTYYATDTKKVWYDDGAAWNDVTPGSAPVAVALTPSAPGNFTVAHGLSSAPHAVVVQMTSGGQIWTQAAADATNLYLTASDGGITGSAICF